MRIKNLAALCIALACLGAVDADAAVDGYRLYLAQRGDIPWQSLTSEEQAVLQRYRGQWDNYSGTRQREMRNGAQRYLQLPPQKRREVEQQQRQYRDLSPDERQRLRDEYQRQRRP